MEFGMSAQGFTKELRGAANGRILGHAAGFLGANLVFGSLYLWGFPFFMWVLHGGWAAAAGKRNNTLVIAANQVPESIDPYFNNVRIGFILAQHVWDHLVYRDPKTNEYKGELATAWRWVDDRTLEFDLRHGVKFHNGDPF